MCRRNNATRLYVGHLSSRTTSRDLEDTFGKYGRLNRVELNSKGYGFVEFRNYLDAEIAMRHLNGVVLNTRRMIVEFAAPKGEKRCGSCGRLGHLAIDCRWCHLCGEIGHYARYCKNASKDISSQIMHDRWSPSPSLGPNQRRQSYSQSRTPPKQDPSRERLSPSRSREPSHSRRRRRSHSRSRKPPIRDLRSKRDQHVPRNQNSQGWQHPRSRHCSRCGLDDHQSRDCEDSKCLSCGEMGHIKKDCMKVFKSIRSERKSPSRSRKLRHSGRRQGYSRSRSPPKRDHRHKLDRNVSRSIRQTRSPSPRARYRSSSGDQIGSSVQGLVDSSAIQVDKDLNVLPRDKSGSPVQGLGDSSAIEVYKDHNVLPTDRNESPVRGLDDSSAIQVDKDHNEFPTDRNGSPVLGLVDSPQIAKNIAI